jgi:UDP-GlcNAc:undecaprenyl-phosphate/decaprenyl-phosphate GlcNAc-1-phosphate transferase
MGEPIGGDPGAAPLSGGLLAILERGDRFLEKVGAKIPMMDDVLTRTGLSSRSLLLMLLGFVLLFVLPPLLYWLLKRIKRVEPNYRKETIPSSYGVVIVLWSGLMLWATAWLYSPLRPQVKLWLVTLVGFGALGLLDDLKGDKTIKGLRGHFAAAGKGKITTGFVKAVGGVLLAFFLSWRLHAGNPPKLVIDAALIALCANFFNLLDLRPGRAGAIFLTLNAVVLWFSVQTSGWFWGVPLVTLIVLPTLIVWERDARAQVMMGDVGSNVLGASLALAIIEAGMSATVRGVVVLLLVGVHLLAERVSLTKLIESNPLLRFLDGLTGVRAKTPKSP